MNKIFDFIEKHKAVFVVACAAAIMAVYMVGTAALDGTREPRAAESAEQAQERNDTQPQSQGSQKQMDAIASADDTSKKLASLITDMPWRAADGAGKLEFNGFGYICTLPDGDSNKEHSGYLAVADVNNASGLDTEDGTYDTTVAALVDKKGMPHVAILSETTQDDPNNPVLRMQCDLFGNAIWTTEYGYTSLKITEMDKKVPELLGISKRKLERALRDWAGAHCSFATDATCSPVVEVDSAAGTAKATFALGLPTTDSANSMPEVYATATVDLKTGSIEITAEQ